MLHKFLLVNKDSNINNKICFDLFKGLFYFFAYCFLFERSK